MWYENNQRPILIAWIHHTQHTFSKLHQGILGLVIELKEDGEVGKHDFFEMEELATVGPKRCNNCLDCNKCSDKNYELSKRERRELQAIRDNMILDKENKESHWEICKDQ